MNPAKKQQGAFTLNKLIAIIVVAAVGYSIYDDLSSSSSPGTSQGARSVRNQPTGPAYAMTLKDSWPPMQKAENSIVDPAQMATANYYLIMDGSGSMADQECSKGRRKVEVAVDAISAFARALPKDSNFGLAAFISSENNELAPLGKQHEAGLQSLSKVEPSGSTPLYSAIKFAYDKLTTQAGRQSGYGEYHLVVVTDGMHSKGQDPTPMVEQIIGKSPVVLHTIGFCISDKHSLNQPGRTYYRSANDPASLKQGLEAVLAESPDFNVDQFEQ